MFIYLLSPAARASGSRPHANPGLRGLALGYTLSPAARAIHQLRWWDGVDRAVVRAIVSDSSFEQGEGNEI
jgi:hypothetical protein